MPLPNSLKESRKIYDYYDQKGPYHAEYEITSAQVTDNVAVVSIDSKFGDDSFDDMFSLVKDGNNVAGRDSIFF